MKVKETPYNDFYRMSPSFKNPQPANTERILRKLLRQKLANLPGIGSGNTPSAVIEMPLLAYTEKLAAIHTLLNRRLRALMQISASGSVSVTTSEEKLYKMLKQMDIECYPQLLVQNHLIDIYLPRYGLAIEVNGAIHDRLFKMNQDINKAEFLKKKYSIDTMSVQNTCIYRYANELRTAIITGSLTKLEPYRSNKVMRDIYLETISYWIQERDLYKLLLMDLDKIPFKDEHFISSILKSFEIKRLVA